MLLISVLFLATAVEARLMPASPQSLSLGRALSLRGGSRTSPPSPLARPSPRSPPATEEIIDVAIIGSGPGGLGAALALSPQNNNNCHGSVAVFERASAFRPIGAALGLNVLGYQALEELGLADRVRSLAANPQWDVLLRPNGEVLYDDESFLKDTEFTWLGWYTLQSTLRERLRDLPEVSVNLRHRLVDFEEDEENSLVRLRFQVASEEDGEETEKIVLARVLVGADGSNSVIRRKTVNDGPPNYTGTMTWRGVLNRDQFRLQQKNNNQPLGRPFHSDEHGNLNVYGDRKTFTVMDCGNGQIAWTGTALQESAHKSADAQEDALKVFHNWPPVVKSLILGVDDPRDIVQSGVFDRDPVDSWGVSDGTFQRVTLLGDAAHAMRPSLGLGSTMALQDALSLSKELSKVESLEDSKSVATALTAYESERIGVTAPLQLEARAQGNAQHREDRADQIKQVLDSALAQKKGSA